MQNSYIVAIHDVKGWIIVVQVLGNLLSIIDCTAKWKENKYEVFVWLINTELIKMTLHEVCMNGT